MVITIVKQGRCGVGRLTVRIIKIMQINIIDINPTQERCRRCWANLFKEILISLPRTLDLM